LSPAGGTGDEQTHEVQEAVGNRQEATREAEVLAIADCRLPPSPIYPRWERLSRIRGIRD
jgi:hypothetical protein